MEGLSELWEQLETNSLLLWVAGVLSLFLVVGIIKRVLTITVLSGVLLLLYFIYVTFRFHSNKNIFQERSDERRSKLQEMTLSLHPGSWRALSLCF